MPLVIDIVDTIDLIGYVRANAVLQGPTLESVLPVQEVDDIKYELSRLEVPTLNVASYRAPDTTAPLGRRAGYASVVGEIAAMGLSMTLNEQELRRFTRLMAELRASGQITAQRIDDIYDDALICATASLIREELARADLLTDGKVTINENGFKTEADFAVPGTHFVTAATAWSDTANATPLTNLAAWEALIFADTGSYPDAWLLSGEVMGNLGLSTQIRNLFPVLGTGGQIIPGIVPPDTLATVARQFGVRAPLVQFDGVVPNSAGTATQPTLGVRKVVAVRAGMGNTLRSEPASAGLLNAAGVQIAPSEGRGMIAFVETEVRPPRVVTTAEMLSLPVLRDPKALFTATV